MPPWALSSSRQTGFFASQTVLCFGFCVGFVSRLRPWLAANTYEGGKQRLGTFIALYIGKPCGPMPACVANG